MGFTSSCMATHCIGRGRLLRLHQAHQKISVRIRSLWFSFRVRFTFIFIRFGIIRTIRWYNLKIGSRWGNGFPYRNYGFKRIFYLNETECMLVSFFTTCSTFLKPVIDSVHRKIDLLLVLSISLRGLLTAAFLSQILCLPIPYHRLEWYTQLILF